MNDRSIWVRPQNTNWPIDIGAVTTQIEYKMIGRWSIDMGTASKTQTDMENDRLILGAVPKTQIDMEMIGRWSIDIGATPTQT